MSDGTNTNPVRLYRVADTATKALTTDPGLGSVQALLGLAESLKSLKLSAITFVTLPNKLDPADTNRLLSLEPAARNVWKLLRDDRPWTTPTERAVPSAQPASPSARTATASSPAPAAAPAAGKLASQAPAPVQTRNASENICSSLPTPSNQGEQR